MSYITKSISISICLLMAIVSVNGQCVRAGASRRPQKPAASASKPPRGVTERASAATIEADVGHEELKEEILNELRQIRMLLEKQQQQPQQLAAAAPAAEMVTVSTAGYSLGGESAPITLVEFADYQCPFCKQFETTTLDRLKKEYVDTGRVRFVSRDLPLDLHPNAMGAAQAARCAGEQDKFWPMRDVLMGHSDNLAPEAIGVYARELGLDMDRFHTCIKKETYLPNIRRDIADANSVGIFGTPTFVIGRTSRNGVEGTIVVGAQPFESFEKLLAEYSAQVLPKN